MSTEKEPSETLDLKQLAELLIKHFGHHKGIFDASFQFQIGVGAVHPHAAHDPLPGAVVAIAGVGLSRADQMRAHSVDAALCNPGPAAKASRKREA